MRIALFFIAALLLAGCSSSDSPAGDASIDTSGSVDAGQPSSDSGTLFVGDAGGRSADAGSATADAGGGQVGWCSLHWPASGSVTEGQSFVAYGWVWIEGVTAIVGKNPDIQGQLGIGAPGSDAESSSGWTWTAGSYNVNVDGLTPGDHANQEYMATISPAPGAYSYAFRFSYKQGPWKYCDLDGSDNGFSASQEGTLAVAPGAADGGPADGGTGGGGDASPPADAEPPQMTDAFVPPLTDGGIAIAPMVLDASLSGFPGITPVSLTSAPYGELLPAPDEVHLAVGHNDLSLPPTGCIDTAPDGFGKLELVSAPRGGAVSSRTVSTTAYFTSGTFTHDGAYFAFLADYTQACDQAGNLYVSGGDGSALRLVESGVDYIDGVAGNTLLYRKRTSSYSSGIWVGDEYLRELPNGPEVHAGSLDYAGEAYLSPTGSAAYVMPDIFGSYSISGAYSLLLTPLNGSTAILVDGQSDFASSSISPVWSNDGTRMAFVHATSGATTSMLSIVNSDGTGRAEINLACTCRGLAFSPDGTQLAYDVHDGDVIIHSFAGARDQLIAGAAPAGVVTEIAFSDDGKVLLVSSGRSYSPGDAKAAIVAARLPNPAFLQLTDHAASIFLDDYAAAISDDFIAVTQDDFSLIVAPLSGGPAVTIAGALAALYEPRSANPRLLTLVNAPATGGYALGVYSTGAIGAPVNLPDSPTTVPLFVQRPFMAMGGAGTNYVLYDTGQSPNTSVPFDLALAAADGSVAGLLGTDLQSYSVANSVPTRAFLLQAPSAGGGVFVVDLP